MDKICKYLFAVLFCLVIGQAAAHATWAHVQGTPAPAATATFGSSVTVGDLVVVTIASANSSGISVADSASNTYTLAKSRTTQVPCSYVYYSQVTTGGALVITITGAGTQAACSIDEYSATAGTITVVSTQSTVNTSTTPNAGGTLAIYASKALFLSSITYTATAETYTPNNSFNLREQQQWVSAVNYGLIVVDLLNGTIPQTVTGSWGTSAAWSSCGVTFQSSGDAQTVGSNWNHIQGAGDYNTNASLTATLVTVMPTSVTAGNLLVCATTMTLGKTITITDTGNNTWHLLTPNGYTNAAVQMYWTQVTTGGTLTVTATYSGIDDAVMSVDEYSGNAGTITAPYIAAMADTSTSSLATANLYYNDNNALLINAYGTSTAAYTLTPGSGYTVRQNQQRTSTSWGLFSQDDINAAPYSSTPSMTLSGTPANATGIAVVFESSGDTNTATNYYVDSVSGSDSNSGTSTGSPFLTIAHAVSVSNPFDTISLLCGDTFTENVSITSYRTFNSYGSGAQPIISGGTNTPAILATNCGGTINNINGINTVQTTYANPPTGVFEVAITDGSSHIDGWKVTNCNTYGGANSILVYNTSTAPNSTFWNVLIQNNTVNDSVRVGIWTAVGTLGTTAVCYSNVNITNNIVENIIGCTASQLTGCGIIMQSANTAAAQNYMQYNYIANCGALQSGGAGGTAGMFPGYCNGVTCQYNIVYNQLTGGGSVDGAAYDEDLVCSNVIFQYNIAYGCRVGIEAFGAGTGNIFRFNLLLNSFAQGIRLCDGGASHLQCYNNTVIGGAPNSTEIYGGLCFETGASANKQIYNNLIIVPPNANAVTSQDTALSGSCAMDYNCYQSGNLGAFTGYINSTAYTSLATWQSTTGVDTHSIVCSNTPLACAGPVPTYLNGAFTNATLYAPVAGSVVAGAGANLLSLYSINPGTHDLAGNALTVPYSIGALAYGVPRLNPYQNSIFTDTPLVFFMLGEAAPVNAISNPGASDTTGSSAPGVFTSCAVGPILGPNNLTTSTTFNGTSSKILVPIVTDYATLYPTISAEAWINETSLNTLDANAIEEYDNAASTESIYLGTINSSELTARVYDHTSTNTLVGSTTGAGIQAGKTYHIVVTMPTSNTLAFYVNGVNIPTVTYTSQQTIANGPLIGSFSAGTTNRGARLVGSVSNGAIYNSALSAARILSHFQAGIQSPSSAFCIGN